VSAESSPKRRVEPAAAAALALVVGLVAGEAWVRGPGSWAPGALAGLAAVAILVFNSRRLPAGLLLVLLFAAGLSRGADRGAAWDSMDRRVGVFAGEAWVRARFRAPPGRGAPLEIVALRPLREGGLTRCDPPLRLVLQGGMSPADSAALTRVGEAEWRGFARLEPGRPPRGPGGWDERAYLRARGAAGFARVLGVEPEERSRAAPRLDPAGSLARARDAIAATLKARFPGDGGLLAASFLLGARGAGPEARGRLAVFGRAGVAHILAVSGVHVGLIAGILALLLGMLPIGWRARLLILAGGIVLYASLVGWGAAVTRAAAGGAIWAVLGAAGRRPDGRTLLLFVLAASLLHQPAAWRDPGLRLSYLVTAALLGAGRGRAPRWARGARVCVAAQSAAWPLVLAHQGSGSPLFLLSNAILVPLAGLLPPFVGIALGMSALPGFPDAVAFAPARAYLGGYLAAVRAAAGLCDRWPIGSELPTGLGLVAGVSVAALWNLSRLRLRLRFAAAIMLVVGVTLIGHPPGRTPAVLMLDVGQGESWLLLWRDETWLIDAGPSPGRGDRPALAIASALHAYGRRGITRLFLTHDDEDHSGGLAELMEQNVPARVIHPPAGWSPSEATRAFLDWARARGAMVEPLQRGDSVGGAGLSVAVANPDPTAGEREVNERCLVLRITGAELTLIVSGDAAAARLEACLRGQEPVAVLSAAHHGSGASTPAGLLAALRPQAVLISVGRGNRFGHPSPLVLERVARAGATLFRTDRDGTIRIDRRGGAWRVCGGVPLRELALRGIRASPASTLGIEGESK
jgi:competence protein ComEC